jgi:hypothetical protein
MFKFNTEQESDGEQKGRGYELRKVYANIENGELPPTAVFRIQ